MKITRLRLLGFKSFVDPTELVIEHGLTGVVGPNGCGKSNLLEALRWAMGETSYKSMRGSAMEDVIFAGSQGRPSRNTCEVTLFIDNKARTAPAEFNGEEELEVTRRIEREVGSAYRVNGRDTRARDIRLLFEDAATGARSPALVGQGRIGEIVSAQPQERRRVLEDAAGIAGLHSRRHEAELRLKATESNLERLADLTGQLTTQLNSLKRQARQAQRYRETSEKIGKREALYHHLMWTGACTAVEEEEAVFQAALSAVGQETRTEAEALRAQAEAAEKLQPLRDEEATRGAVLHRLTVERETLDREEERAQARHAELENRLAQTSRDLAREEEHIAEAEEMLRSLGDEERKLNEVSTGDDEEPRLREAAERSAGLLQEAEAALGEATEALAQERAEKRRLESEVAELDRRIARLEEQKATILEDLAIAEERDGNRTDLAALNASLDHLTHKLGGIEDELSAAEAAEEAARNAESELRGTASSARLRRQQLDTELATLLKLLKPASQDEWQPLVEQVKVQGGYEEAIGTALGDDLDAASDEEAPAHWRQIAAHGEEPALPGGVTPLSDFVSGASVLERRLAQIGVVAQDDGDRLQKELKVGQRLVSKEGDLWRWDGYSVRAGAATAAAARLVERRRLESLKEDAEKAEREAHEASDALETAIAKAREASEATKALRQQAKETQREVSQIRDAITAAEHEIQKRSKALGALVEARTRTEDSLNEAKAESAKVTEALQERGGLEALEAKSQAAQEAAAEARSAHAKANADLEAHQRGIRIRHERMQAITGELELWQKRIAKAGDQIETLRSREQETRNDLIELAKLPEDIEQRRNSLLNAIARAEKERAEAADALAEADTDRRAHERTLREVQERLAGAREAKARSEAKLEAARNKRSEVSHTIREQFDCAPEDCLKLAELEEGKELPHISQVEAELHKLKADRERLGAVNLRAEEEEAEISGQLEEMDRERADVEAAIASLRKAIADLNREGRKRLLDAFDTVNAHFKRLFEVLFGGGAAELQLVESDDPLQSGLEIVARPPGKKPQVLTLLSGGEKALTAMALIFAVFLTNPSPICVLDEVDAPLDDANVERFCNLMEEMANSTDTRFLVITHHPLTMARMNRLFGVTMAERGVSQLVSVDLETAEQLRDAV
ncbi:chromosome segregation protein SMC [Methyloligella sp. 2.7D]|uniref:chromosome segregation protein SMC n=1 Tax=unclassified Methyloligella TaxID=2625955 RepID=UPI00157E14AA|nr:chromosome segregation protein SMC [Methyloligella sp. GL2]QKP78311.1 chromosome segregation protein SMC [Methyloligella sp. GL2]